MTPTCFNTWLRETYGISKWVVARRTKRAQARYPDSEFFSPKRYRELCEEHRVLVRDDQVIRIAAEHELTGAFEALVEAFEAGRKAL